MIVEDKYLSIQLISGASFIPTAKDIYMAEFKRKLIINEIHISKPSDQLFGIKISKFPLDLRLKLVNKDGVGITAESIVLHNNQNIIVSSFDKGLSDHLIIDGTWYPYVNGANEKIANLLTQVGIKELDKINLRQYVNLRSSGNPYILDEVTSLPLDKSAVLDKSVLDIPGFIGKLYPYQYQGYRWLQMISDQDAGCILADEMGLGKTAQIIALLSSEGSRNNNPSLVVAPVTLLENWKREFAKFAPSLKILIHQGARRTGLYSDMLDFQVVITSYETVLRDLSIIEMIDWNIVVTDEAQAIKNPSAKRTIAIKQIPRRTSIAVTGTPVENRLIDLWSLADFSFPSFLGDINQFEMNYPEEVLGASSLEPVISPIMLRRRVKEVAGDLPERIDIPQVLELSDSEIEGYESLRQSIIEEYGKNASLVSLIKLRMYCTHPFLKQDHKDDDDPSNFVKYKRMIEILEEIISNKEKAIIFTSYTKMTDIMVGDLSIRLGIYCDFIDGRVEVGDRQIKIDTFGNIDGSAVLILNPRAAGSGLNITAANHVIHYNLEWNPALEDQASARAYRRGQTRPVNVYKLYLADTVEETINDRVERKRALSDTAVVGTDGSNDYTDILQALMKSPSIKRSNDSHETNN
ncbi:hypothetical protein R50345_30515 [Paenibacillus sp. FSL R5-0345]|nr:hypothetical protein R50345_30515 [Paenibacillus sp. FSL R5-0345]